MAIKQTVAFNNTNSTIGDIETALVSINSSIVDITQKQELQSRLAQGEFTPSIHFDADAQTLTIERIWPNEADFNSYKTNWPGEGDNKVSLEQAGWVCLAEVVETI